ncbi:putative C2 domain-containing protein [Helianthus annuus]|uniref:C2 domain-containing protein n=1 Tax=Helianthus annuus TaxID=4232 RepID=A0A251VAB6_HELAN|nr:protein SRC2 [Helianthus annuus]KAF5815436.1 putative C2 domain-containing protein [Helianthus annuus]KAJ0768989.1 putative C2 domain-containing protein [Helianthus annuus]KAJ0774734.1 putative C2 domain-containing protein [Helianthus annuus]KAJ0936804.1 putative C2 domain-containing protein [Helianthus annuus]
MGGETSLELTIISAKDLYNVNIFAKMNVYAVVSITGNQDQKQKTHVDEDGDSNPTWNHRMKFTIDESAALQNRLTLVVNIKAVGMFGDKDVGEVHVPVKELLDGDYTGRRPLQFVCYQVLKPSGHPKGELSFSYKFGGKSEGKPNKADKLDEPAMAYPAVGSGFGSEYPPLYAGTVGAALGSYLPTSTVDPGSYPYPPDEGVSPFGKPNKVDKLDEPNMVYPAVGSEFSSVYPPLYATPVSAALESYPPAPTMAAHDTYPPTGGAYYPPPAGYPQAQAGYAYQWQPTYDVYPPQPAPGYGGYTQWRN